MASKAHLIGSDTDLVVVHSVEMDSRDVDHRQASDSILSRMSFDLALMVSCKEFPNATMAVKEIVDTVETGFLCAGMVRRVRLVLTNAEKASIVNSILEAVFTC